MCKNCNIDTLVIANVSKTQVAGLTKELVKNGFYFTLIDSSGGLLQGSTNTLLIGIIRERYNDLMDLLRICCQRKITHVPTQTQMETFAHYSQPMIIEAQTGGAMVHTIPVEHFEQF
jgi:uncharacterized protein YaaQ